MYGGKIAVLRSELAKRLKWAVLESERRSRPASTKLIELSIHGVRLSSGLQNEPIVVKVAISATSRMLRIPIQLRNESVETLKAISHVYLFSEQTPLIVPAKLKSDAGGNPYIKLNSFKAPKIDAPDGLSRQYRSLVTFPDLPPRATELKWLRFISLMRSKALEVPSIGFVCMGKHNSMISSFAWK